MHKDPAFCFFAAHVGPAVVMLLIPILLLCSFAVMFTACSVWQQLSDMLMHVLHVLYNALPSSCPVLLALFRQSWSRCAPPSATAATSGAMADSWGVWMVKPMGKTVIFHGFVDLRNGLRGWMCGFIWLYNVSYIYIYIYIYTHTHTQKWLPLGGCLTPPQQIAV